MRICMLAYTFYETDNRVRRYAEALARRGDIVDAIVLRRESQPSYEVINGVHVRRIQRRTVNEKGPLSYLAKLLLFFFRSALAVTIRHLGARYDLIHVHSVPDFEVFATIMPHLLGARVILDIHDIVPEFYASKFKVHERSFVFRFLVLIEKLSIAYANHVIIANHLWHTKLVQRSVRPEKCTALINYPDLSIFSRRTVKTALTRDFVMCYPGTLNEHQGVDVAITAMTLLRHKAPELKFLIVGDGPERDRLNQMIRDHRLEDRITFAGLIPMEQVASILETVDLGIVPKRKDSFGDEAFSTKIMEFMAMGVPVIASSTRIDQYYFNQDQVAFFQSGSAEDLASKILDLMRSPEKRQALRLRALDFIQENNWNVKKHKYLQLVDCLVCSDQKGLAYNG